MVTRVNGAPRQGAWFSAGVRFVELTVDTTTFLTDLTVAGTADVVNSDLEIVIELLQQRGTVIGMSVETASIVQFMVDYGQAVDPLAGTAIGNQTAQNIEAEFEAAVIANTTATAAAVVVQQGFKADALGVPA